MSIEAAAVYVYNGAITDLLSSVHKATFAKGITNLTVITDLNMVLASQSQVLMNQAKLSEFMDLVKSFAPNPATANSGLNDLEKLADLRDKGIITPTEFEAKKKQILGI